MTDTGERSRLFDRVVSQLQAREGVSIEDNESGSVAVEISGDRGKAAVELGPASSDYRDLKAQYGALRDALTELGIEEGMTYVPPKPPKRAMTPEMRAARAKQQKEFEAWQELWRLTRRAEKALDVEFELAQMKDYY